MSPPSELVSRNDPTNRGARRVRRGKRVRIGCDGQRSRGERLRDALVGGWVGAFVVTLPALIYASQPGLVIGVGAVAVAGLAFAFGPGICRILYLVFW